jgi:hypothetical protein
MPLVKIIKLREVHILEIIRDGIAPGFHDFENSLVNPEVFP